jgi:vacuolar-type H+-ATPase subunit E/Vma4
MVDVARALSGIGAAFKNEIPQFQQRIQQEDLYKMKMADMDRARQDADAKREEARKKTFFQDVAVAKQYFDAGDFGSIADIARDRLNILTPMGVNTRDSQQMLQLADAARAGDTSAIQQLKNQLDISYSVGQLYGVIPKAEVKPNVTLGKGEILLGPDNQVLYSNVEATKPEVRQTYQDRMGVTRYRDTGRTVYEESQAGMSATQPTAQAQPSQSGATELSPEDAYLAGLSPADQVVAKAERDERTRKQTEFEQEQQAITNQEQMIIDEAKTAYMIAKELRDNKAGLEGAVGPISSRLPSISEDTVEFESKLDYLQSLLTLGNLGRMTGVLSESDLALLSKAASGLDVGVGEAAFTQQLNTIINDLEKGLLAKEVDLSTVSRPSTRTGDWRKNSVFDAALRNEGLVKGV